MVDNSIDAGRRANLGVSRGVLKKANDATKMQEVQVDVMQNETHDNVEHWHAYGFTSVPQADGEALIAYLGGSRAHPIVIAVGDRRYRMKGLANGEMAIHDDQGQSVHITRGGVVITTTHATILAPTITLDGDVTVTKTLTVSGASVTHAGVNIGKDHEHTEVTPGPSNTGPPAS